MSGDMKHGTAIEWTHLPGTKGETWNPIRARNKETGGLGHFCTHVSAGCKNCYAERLQVRFKNPVRYAAQDADKVEVFLDEKTLLKPLQWSKPRTIFVCSMTDLFGEFVSDEWLNRIFSMAALCPQHIFIYLTKRPKRARGFLMNEGLTDQLYDCAADTKLSGTDLFGADISIPLPNVWLGTSVEDQETANERIPYLLTTPAAVRFVSYEPALGPVNFEDVWPDLTARMNAFSGRAEHGLGFQETASGLDWLIAGGESGPSARAPDPDWFRDARDQCAAAGVPFFFKQWGEWLPADDLPSEEMESLELQDRYGRVGDADLILVGKKRAGSILDGVEHKSFPELAS